MSKIDPGLPLVIPHRRYVSQFTRSIELLRDLNEHALLERGEFHCIDYLLSQVNDRLTSGRPSNATGVWTLTWKKE